MDAISIASIAMQDDLQRLTNISQNLANVGTVGYKRHIAVSRPFEQFLADGSAGVADGAGTALSALDMRSGTLRTTSNPLDLAMDGPGFFEVASDSGAAWARQGTMRIDARGRLVTQQGWPLAGVNGDIRPNGGTLAISFDGEVRQGERLLGQLHIARFADPGKMQSLGNGLYAQGAAMLFDAAGRGKGGPDAANAPGQLRSGFQENSNVNSAEEMVRLTETVRHFETMQKVMQGYGDVFDQTLRKLGEF